jgi:hypothetical protein
MKHTIRRHFWPLALTAILAGPGCSGFNILPEGVRFPTSLSFPGEKGDEPVANEPAPPARDPAPPRTPDPAPRAASAPGRAATASTATATTTTATATTTTTTPSTSYSWAELSARGRDALGTGELAAAQSAFLSALAQTETFPAHDVRVHTSLLNLTYLARAQEKAGNYAAAEALIEVLIAQERGDRRVGFDVAGPLMLAQAERLRDQGNEIAAARMAQAALRLPGSSDPMNAQLRAQAEQALWPAPASPEAEAEPKAEPKTESMDALIEKETEAMNAAPEAEAEALESEAGEAEDDELQAEAPVR